MTALPTIEPDKIAAGIIASDGAPASPYEAAMDALKAWDGIAPVEYLSRLRAGLFDAELADIRARHAPMIGTVLRSAAA